MTALAGNAVHEQIHELLFRDDFFRCICSKIHPVKDIDDAKVAQAAHEKQEADASILTESEPPVLAQIRSRMGAATQGPQEWLGSSLESRYATAVEVSVNCSSYCYGGSPSVEMSEGDKAFLEHAQVDVSTAVAGLDAVLALHGPRRRGAGGMHRLVCDECSRGLPGQGSNAFVAWPCRTTIALRDGLSSGQKAALEFNPYDN